MKKKPQLKLFLLIITEEYVCVFFLNSNFSQLDAGIDIIDDKSNAEYMLSGSEDNIVAYRILQLSNDSPKNNQTISATTSVPQQLQYILLDNSNGFIQAVPTTQINAVSSTPIKIESQSTNSSSNSNSLKMRSSIAIAPKIDFLPSTPYSSSTTSNSTVSTKSNVSCVNTFILKILQI